MTADDELVGSGSGHGYIQPARSQELLFLLSEDLVIPGCEGCSLVLRKAINQIDYATVAEEVLPGRELIAEFFGTFEEEGQVEFGIALTEAYPVL